MTETVAAEVFLLSGLAALLLGAGPVFSKRGLALGATYTENVLAVLATRGVLLWIVLLVVSGADPLAGLSPPVAGVFLLGGVLASGAGRLFLSVGIDRVGSSLSNAFGNVRPVFAVLLAVAWLGEVVTPGMAVGVVVIVGGLVLLSLSRGGDISGWERTDLAFPLVAALLFAGGNVVRRYGFTVSPIDSLRAVTVGETGALVAVVGFAVATKGLSIEGPRRAFGYFAVTGALASAGLLSLFAALRIGPVTVVDPVVATAPLVTTGVAAVLLGDLERITRRLVAGVALVVVGVAVLTVATP